MGTAVDIAMLPGMTPAWESGLRTLAFHTSADLLRANRRALVAAMPALPLSQLRGWQAYAQLLEVAGVEPAMCGVLITAAIGSLDELSSRRLTQLQAVVAAAGLTATDDGLAAILQDAVRLKSLGVLNLNVADADGQPLSGVTASCDGVHATSDARGRIRLVRLRLGVSLTLELNHPVLGMKTVTSLRASPLAALRGVKIGFPRRHTAPRVLSALRGDKLPALGSAPVTTAAQAGSPENSDILRLIDRYSNGDARMASRFLDYSAGHFVVRTYRMPQASLPAALQGGDDVHHDGTQWAIRRISAREIARTQRLRAIKKPWIAPAAPTPAQLDQHVKKFLSAYSDKASGGPRG